jgi:multimeric flavodoxin WrbA
LKVLALAGSPRRGGNTETLVDRVLAGAASAGAETEKIVACNLKMRGCLHCGGCDDTGVCVQQDDMTGIYLKLQQMDAFVLASPLMFMNVSSQAKMVIDRLQCLWVAKYVLKQPFSGGRRRRGLFICAGGMDRPEMFAGVHMTIRAVFGTLDLKLAEELLYPHTDEKGAILGHPTALEDAFASGRSLVTGPDAGSS